MSTKSAILIGAGGHGRVVLEAWLLSCHDVEIQIRDDNPSSLQLLGKMVQCPALPIHPENTVAHIAIGQNATRRKIAQALLDLRGELVSVVHPRGLVSQHAVIDDGVFVAANATIAPGARIHQGAIVNHGAIVDHDCRVGAWSHVAPGVVLGGCVDIGSGVLLGSGAVVLPGVKVADGCTIGSGAVVTRNIPENECWIGVPARKIYGGD